MTFRFVSSASVVALVSIFAPLAAGCGGRISETSDGGDDAGLEQPVDAEVAFDARVHPRFDGGHLVDASLPPPPPPPAFDSGPTSGCAPANVSGFVPSPYQGANVQHGACTMAQIDGFYAGCLSAGSTSQTCAPYGPGGTAANKVCAGCLVSPDTAPKYGVLVESKGNISLNVAGCMEIRDGANGLACAKQYQASEKCDAAACAANCPVTDDASFQLYQACVQQASSNGCAAYTQSASCANAEADGGPASICFSGQTFQDLYRSIAPVFCQ